MRQRGRSDAAQHIGGQGHIEGMPTKAEVLDFESNYQGWTGQQEEDIRLRFGF